MTETTITEKKETKNPFIKLALELGPLVIFSSSTHAARR